MKVLDARDFRIAHMRKRMFIVALLKNAVKSDFMWPKASAVRPSICKHLDQWDPKTDKAGRLPKALRAQKIVKKAYKAAHKLGLDPLKDIILVDYVSSTRFSSWQAHVVLSAHH